jgi:hypothetical protein
MNKKLSFLFLLSASSAIAMVQPALAHDCASCAKTRELMATERKLMDAITSMSDAIITTITAGVQQITNNIKAAVEANTRVMEEINKDRVVLERQRGIGEARGEFRYNQTSCSPVASGLQWGNAAWISGTVASQYVAMNNRVFQAQPGTPAWADHLDSVNASATAGAAEYCDERARSLGLCKTVVTEKMKTLPDVSFAGAHLNAMTVMHPNLLSYQTDKDEKAGRDFIQTYLDPLTPTVDKSIDKLAGRENYARRKGRDAMVSVANSVTAKIMKQYVRVLEVDKSPYTQFTELQKRYLQSINRETTGKFSEAELLDMEVKRRYGNLDYGKELQKLNTNGLLLEANNQLALSNVLTKKLIEKIDDLNMTTSGLLAKAADDRIWQR